MAAKILFVDDDPNILAAYQRQLRRQYEIDTALAGEQGLEAVAKSGPYAVIVSDLKMPGMNGIQFLSRVKEMAPDTVRMMLTGFAEVKTAIDAVNEGNIFRFLTKPCPPEILSRALDSGIEQYRLITAEKELLEKTLKGSIKVLTEILSLLNPEAFGRASRISRYSREIGLVMKIREIWQLETAAMLSQIGFILLPEGALKKIYHGQQLTPEEIQLMDMHPFITSDLLKNIPRLEEIARIISYQEKHFDGTGIPVDEVRRLEIPLGARVLKVALDFDTLLTAGLSKSKAITQLKHREGWYDPGVLTALEAVVWIEGKYLVKVIHLKDLQDSMILDDDVFTMNGTLLIAKGQEVTRLIIQRLHNFAETEGIKEPLQVLVPLREKSSLS
jgi:response regulator RpfG family c-di-GMP phosphodiesterase